VPGIIRAWICVAACSARAATFQDSFATDPLANGWAVYGDTNLFAWDPTNQNLAVTWDSSQTNSYFYRPLGTILGESDDFGFAFDLQFSSVIVGVDTNKPDTFEVAMGLSSFQSASDPALERGIGVDPVHGVRNIAEFDYFPDSGYGATVSPTIVSSNNQFATSFSFPLTMDPGALFHVVMTYTASNLTLVTSMTRNGQSFGPIKKTVLGTSFTDFRLDQFAISSYSDAGADGSILAQGTVDNIVIMTPPPPIGYVSGSFTNGTWQVEFESNTNWVYTLRRSKDLIQWNDASTLTPGNGMNLFLQDTNNISNQAMYRVEAERP
jgi:hypothetical protein